MEITKTVQPVEKGNKQLFQRYGDRLVCELYRFDRHIKSRYRPLSSSLKINQSRVIVSTDTYRTQIDNPVNLFFPHTTAVRLLPNKTQKKGILQMSFYSYVCTMVVISLLATASAAADVMVMSAVTKDTPIAGADLTFYKTGKPPMKSISNSQGKAPWTAALGDDADVTLTIKKSGYSDISVQCPCRGMNYAMSPLMNDGIRITLTWGDMPRNLDAHLFFGETHIDYLNRHGNGASLDVDGRDGLALETITIAHPDPDQRYIYAVHDNDPGSYKYSSLSQNRAKVLVYRGSSLIKEFRPTLDVGVNMWVVFGIDKGGAIKEINSFTSEQNIATLRSHLARVADNQYDNFSTPQEILIKADELNKKGEGEYHKGAYSAAESYFQLAIEKNPKHALAYSNLALVYVKLGRIRDALNANERAIELATGDGAEILKAGSYFNMGRIYEDRGDWAEALDNYSTAERLRNLKTYRQGIERMQRKLSEMH